MPSPLDGLGVVFKPVGAALLTGVPVKDTNASPSSSRSPSPGGSKSPAAPATSSAELLPGFEVTGFTKTMDHESIAKINVSLVVAATMAQVVVARLETKGKEDPDFLTMFKDATYFEAVLGVYKRIASLLPLVSGPNSPAGNVKITKATGADAPAGSKGAYDKHSNEIELYPAYWALKNLPGDGKLTGAEYKAWLSTAGADGVEAVYESQETVLLHEMTHLMSQDMPLFQSIIAAAKVSKKRANFGLDNRITDVKFGDFSIDISPRDNPVFALIQDPPAAQIPRGSTARRMKQEENAYGVQFTKFLAKLQNGAMATVLNADNYAVFAAMCCDAAWKALP